MKQCWSLFKLNIMNEISISLNLTHLSMKMNWKKDAFHWEKWNFELTRNSVYPINTREKTFLLRQS